jgi:hypothetical protein
MVLLALCTVLTAGAAVGDPTAVDGKEKTDQQKLFKAVADQQKLSHALSPKDAILSVAKMSHLSCANVESAYFHTLFDEDIAHPSTATFVSAYCNSPVRNSQDRSGRPAIVKAAFMQTNNVHDDAVPSSYAVHCVTDAQNMKSCTVDAQY